MDDYREFQGSANLDQLKVRKASNSASPEDETILMILDLGGLNLEKLIEQGVSTDMKIIRERQYDLNDAARTLTNDVAGRWGQAPYRIQFLCDGQKFFTEIEETKKDIGMIPLEEQSKGFRWFFSFDLRFMHDSGGTFANCVLLLDEPGVHLHPGGQEDLLKRLDAYAVENTLIYTTHLPFLVDLREPGELAESGRIAGSTHVPRGMLEFRADPTSPYHQEGFQPERRIILHCATGGRSALAAAALKDMGYTNVAHLDGGLKAWVATGRPVEFATAPAK